MKKMRKKFLSIALACAFALPVFSLAACGEKTTNYRVVGTDETYEYTVLPKSTVKVDDGIAIDGKFEEAFYTRAVQNWYRASKTDSDVCPRAVLRILILR